jgi:hypothetical protein
VSQRQAEEKTGLVGEARAQVVATGLRGVGILEKARDFACTATKRLLNSDCYGVILPLVR